MRTALLATLVLLAGPRPATAETAAEDLQARSLAATCASCHGTGGQARGEIKPLAGRPADRIVAAISDFRSGTAPATVMHQIAKGYTDDQVRRIAAWFAAQPAAH